MHIAIKKGGTPIWYHYLRSSLCIHMCVCVRAKGGVVGPPSDALKFGKKGWGFHASYLALRLGWYLNCLVGPSDCFSLPV